MQRRHFLKLSAAFAATAAVTACGGEAASTPTAGSSSTTSGNPTARPATTSGVQPTAAPLNVSQTVTAPTMAAAAAPAAPMAYKEAPMLARTW